ncbi:D-3-phosphoglycerate dehydrogenase [Lewinella aquimaris]|uniref:D-3-phosphoglycerate dehydrogenase n=1 Tax=Neolewinella aquimaris TaxID=1835722 RepID=A0A840EA27_9BACT|nr:phosphoglycerate dehydrogenase [Neolewinella aquimaris]MBB4080237.1 D-3-phosphoglycerate dehydrogenase [Neolewinella aquimaris]
MNDLKLAVTSPSFSTHPVLQKEILKSFPGAKLNLDGTRFVGQELIDYIQDAEALVIGLEQMDACTIDACRDLKIIAKYGVGLNNIDLDHCKRKGIKIGWTGGVNRRSVSEMVLGFMLSLGRNLYVTSNLLKQGKWRKNGGFQLTGKTIGIIGCGYIGKDLVELLKPFKCTILVNDILDLGDFCEMQGVRQVSLDKLYAEADFVTVHTPLTPETSNLLDAEAFSRMKQGAIVINTARGGIVHQKDLIAALESGQLGGAALDTYIEEPPENPNLLQVPNLMNTPHIGGNAIEAVEAMGMSAITHLRKFYGRE